MENYFLYKCIKFCLVWILFLISVHGKSMKSLIIYGFVKEPSDIKCF
jgi:hypothetical protein